MNHQASPSDRHFATIAHVLRARAAQRPDAQAYLFLADGEDDARSLSYGELDARARSIAVQLSAQSNVVGVPVLLMHPAGLDFVAAFFGALYAGAIPVPLYPPRPRRVDERVRAIVSDCDARLVLATADVLADENFAASVGNDITCLATDQAPSSAAEWREPEWTPQQIALLQYTSGSTSAPKGVMVAHGNLMANMRAMTRAHGLAENAEQAVLVTWLPMFHDMGLIGNMLMAVRLGMRCVFMPPALFLQKPVRWLRAISRYRGTESGAPNFAYDLCVTRTTVQDRMELDLSSWRVAFNGAEPVRAATLQRFIEAFSPHGFKAESLRPVYGMAESTLMVAVRPYAGLATTLHLDALALEANTVRSVSGDQVGVCTVVGCGRADNDEEIAIVDPETGVRRGEGQVGEIWLANDSVAQGYWNKPVESRQTFENSLADSPRRFLRTGDLGFLHEEELYITGRLKDLIIVRGRNLYPQDIEATVEQAHPAVRRHGCAAVTISAAGEERLIIITEIERSHLRNFDATEIFKIIQRQVHREHEVRPRSLYCLKPGSLPRTSSGKLRRSACRLAIQQSTLAYVAECHEGQELPAARPLQDSVTTAVLAQEDARLALQTWLLARVAATASLPLAEVSVHRPLADYGLESSAVMQLAGELEQHLGRRVAPTLLYQCPTIEALASTLTQSPAAAAAAKTASASAAGDDIAIVGIGCRFPGAHGPDQFWQLLRDGVDAVTRMPAARAALGLTSGAALLSESIARGGFLDDIEWFDTEFFGIAAREARCMDPQQRLLLESAYEALQDAGVGTADLRGSRAGVFIGICNSDYGALAAQSPTPQDPRWTTGNAASLAANRISYAFDLKGPSLAIDTACSSSLVAVHLACQSLRRGESSLALAGGVNLILRSVVTAGFASAGALSSDARCKAFDAQADGMVRSEGVGVVILKPLVTALAEGDCIYAVIRGSAVNQDGLSNGITAPNESAQQAVLQDACNSAGVAPAQVQYVEAHGTGTLLGDPIEAGALGAIVGRNRAPEAACRIGSVKSNIGHTEAAAGIASLIKVALALHHRQLPPSLHYRVPNPHIAFEELGLRVQTQLEPWPTAVERLAGVSAFGFGGTNAHVVLAGAPPHSDVLGPATEPASTAHLLPISATSARGLQQQAQAFATLLAQPHAWSLADLCDAASTRREHQRQRAAITFRTEVELQQRLNAFVEQGAATGVAHVAGRVAGTPKIAFVFPGHRGLRWNFERNWLERYPAFAATIEQCAVLFKQYASWSLRERMLDREPLETHQVDVYFPCQFAFQVAQAALWNSWGVRPHAVVGHSFGEVAAACVAGALTLPDAVRLIFARSRLLQEAAKAAPAAGGMLAVQLSRQAIQPLLDAHAPQIQVVVSNSPSNVVVAGDVEGLAALTTVLRSQQVFHKLLDVPGAGHSKHLQRDSFTAQLQGLRPRPTQTRIVSSVTGGEVPGEELTAGYWLRNVSEPVLFAEAIQTLAGLDYDAFVEISPFPPVLTHAVQECVRNVGKRAAVLPMVRRDPDERAHLLDTAAELYVRGCDLHWNVVQPPRTERVPLPLPAWNRAPYWLDSRAQSATIEQRPMGKCWQSALQPQCLHWETLLDAKVLGDRLQGWSTSPMSLYEELALAAGRDAFDRVCTVQDIAPASEVSLVGLLLDGKAQRVQLVLSLEGEERATVQFLARATEAGRLAPWTLLGTAAIECSATDARSDVADFTPGHSEAGHAEPGAMRNQVLQAPAAERVGLLCDYLRQQVAVALGVAVPAVAIDVPLNTLGMDSLMALQIKNRVEAELAAELPVVKLLAGADIAEVAAALLEQLTAPVVLQAHADSLAHAKTTHELRPDVARQLLEKIDELPDAEVDRLLAALEAAEADADVV